MGAGRENQHGASLTLLLTFRHYEVPVAAATPKKKPLQMELTPTLVLCQLEPLLISTLSVPVQSRERGRLLRIFPRLFALFFFSTHFSTAASLFSTFLYADLFFSSSFCPPPLSPFI
jgi:hypothetical protein